MIRKITMSDKDEYLAMVHDFYHSPAVLNPVPDEYFVKTFDELMHSDTYAEAYIFERGGAVTGYALLAKTFSQEAGGLAVWIEELYIKPEYRGMGIGSEALDYIRQNVPAARYRLETEPENERAAQLYCRHGFRPLGYIGYYIDTNSQK